MSRLELSVMAGKESKEWLESLTNQIDRLERLVSRLPQESGEDEETIDTEMHAEIGDNDELAPRTKRATKAKPSTSFDDDEEEQDEEVGEDDDNPASFDDADEEEEEPAPRKAAKGKAAASKVTIDDVNDACKARATRSNRADVLGILKKKFKVKSVTELKPSQYQDVIAAMKGK